MSLWLREKHRTMARMEGPPPVSYPVRFWAVFIWAGATLVVLYLLSRD